MASSLDKTVDLGSYARLLWRRKSILMLAAATTVCATLIALTFIPSEYESEVTLMIEESRLISDELEDLMGGLGSQPSRRGIDEERMSRLMGRIRSRPFLERVIRMLKMNEDPLIREQAEARSQRYPEVSADEMAIRILQDNLQSRIRFGSAGTGIYKVIVADYSAENAQVLAKWISELFVDTSDQESLERIKAAREFGTEQLRIYEEQLRRSENALERYNRSVIERNLTHSVVRRENLTLAEALHRRMIDEATIARVRLKPHTQSLLELGIVTDQPVLREDSEIKDLAQSLSAALQNDLLDQLGSNTGDVGDWTPPLSYSNLRRDLLQRIELVSADYYRDVAPEVLRVVTTHAFSKFDLEAQQAAADMIGGAISTYKRQAESSPGGAIELTRLESEVETNRRLLQSFQAQLVASDVSQAVEMTKLGLQIEILDPARMPLSPSRPNRMKILAASLFLGALLGTGIAFLSETLDPVMRSLSDFAKIVPEPLLGTTPLLSHVTDHRPWVRRHWIPLALALVIGVTGAVFLIRSSVLQSWATTGQPVKVVNPEGSIHENP